MSKNSRGGPVAQSLYRQFRVTCTQEISGRVSYSIYAKGLNDTWKEQHCLVRDTLHSPPHALMSTEDVVIMLIGVLREQLLPGIDPAM